MTLSIVGASFLIWFIPIHHVLHIFDIKMFGISNEIIGTRHDIHFIRSDILTFCKEILFQCHRLNPSFGRNKGRST